MVTGVDLVAEQLRVASGLPLSFGQSDIGMRGHAIECRINAEDPDQDFIPQPGTIEVWKTPTGDGLRFDSHCFPGYTVPPFYDSLLGKLIVHAPDRGQAVARMITAIDQFEVTGLPTTLPFHRKVMSHPDFIAGHVTTRWVEETYLPAERTGQRALPNT
jgi:acetyl-CoA carboxylase biotin carboxylase subunit